MPTLKIIDIPQDLIRRTDYGLLVRNGAPADAWRLALYVLSPEGQKMLKQYGFEATAIPGRR